MTLLAVGALLVLAGCARFGGGGPASGEPSGTAPGDPPIAIPDPLPPSDGPSQQHEVPDPSVIATHPAAIDHFTLGPDGRTVVVYWWGGNPSCFGLKGVRLDAEHATPTITVLEGTRESARDRMCTMEARLKSAVVVLDAPILVDAANPDADAGEAIIFEGTQAVQPVDGVRDPRPHAVSGYALSPDGLTLSIYYVGGTERCYGLESATARQEGEAGSLTVSVREGWIAADDVACDDIGVPKVVQVTLDRPLMQSGTEEL